MLTLGPPVSEEWDAEAHDEHLKEVLGRDSQIPPLLGMGGRVANIKRKWVEMRQRK